LVKREMIFGEDGKLRARDVVEVVPGTVVPGVNNSSVHSPARVSQGLARTLTHCCFTRFAHTTQLTYLHHIHTTVYLAFLRTSLYHRWIQRPQIPLPLLRKRIISIAIRVARSFSSTPIKWRPQQIYDHYKRQCYTLVNTMDTSL
jgi:hypothetical protein